MPTLTTDGSGTGSDTSITLTGGRRYVFAWGKDAIGPTTGTLTPSLDWQVNESAAQGLHKPDQSTVTYDLSAVNSGSIEFVAPVQSIFTVLVTGGGASKTIYFHVTEITGR